MTVIETGAWLLSAVFIKGSVVAVGTLILARIVAKSASGAALILGLGLGALGLVAMLGPLVPDLGSGFVSIRHETVQDLRIGALALSPALILIGVWVIGAGVMFLRFSRDLSAARGLVRRASSEQRRASSKRVSEQREAGSKRVSEQRVARLLRRAAAGVGSNRTPQALETTELATVALIGFRRPVLLIPVQAREWSDEELFGVLCHELEHVRRGDWLMLMLERIVAALYWPNPLIHLARRAAAASRELAADDAAMRSGAGAEAFAERLIAVARDLRTTPRLAVSVAFAEGGGVDRRVRALFERDRDRGRVTGVSMLRAGLITLPLVIGLAALEPWSCLPAPDSLKTTACP